MTEPPYVQISRARRWGYDIDIVDAERFGGQKRSDCLRASTWHAFKWATALTKARKMLARYNKLLKRESEAWKIQ
jgi:hypothetical protein